MNPEEYRVMAELEGVQWWYAGMRRIARALLEPLLPEAGSRSRRILDAGCGTGWNLQALSVFGETHGVDLSPLAASATRRRGGRVSLGNLLSLPYGSASFDVVTSFDVIYHAWVVDDVQAVRELARVLKPGGVLLLKAPALKILWGAHDEAVLSRHRYTRPEMETLVRRPGSPWCDRPTQTPSSSRSSSRGATSIARSIGTGPTWRSSRPCSRRRSARCCRSRRPSSAGSTCPSARPCSRWRENPAHRIDGSLHDMNPRST
jgi:hypothetical protein